MEIKYNGLTRNFLAVDEITKFTTNEITLRGEKPTIKQIIDSKVERVKNWKKSKSDQPNSDNWLEGKWMSNRTISKELKKNIKILKQDLSNDLSNEDGKSKLNLDDLDKIKEAINSLTEVASHLKHSGGINQNKLNKFNKSLAIIQSSVSDKITNLNLESEKVVLTQTNTQLYQEKVQLTKEKAQLEAELKTKADQAEVDIKTLKESLTKSEKSITQSTTNLSLKQNEFAELQKKTEESQNQLKSTEQELAQLKIEKEEISSQLNPTKQEIKSLKEQIEHLKSFPVSSTETKTPELEKQPQLNETLKELESLLDTKEKQLKTNTNDLHNKIREVEVQDEQIKYLNRILNTKSLDLAQKNLELTELKNEIETNNQKNIQLNEEIGEKIELLEDIHKAMGAFRAEASEIKKNVGTETKSMAEKALMQFQNDLKKSQQKLADQPSLVNKTIKQVSTEVVLPPAAESTKASVPLPANENARQIYDEDVAKLKEQKKEIAILFNNLGQPYLDDTDDSLIKDSKTLIEFIGEGLMDKPLMIESETGVYKTTVNAEQFEHAQIFTEFQESVKNIESKAAEKKLYDSLLSIHKKFKLEGDVDWAFGPKENIQERSLRFMEVFAGKCTDTSDLEKMEDVAEQLKSFQAELATTTVDSEKYSNQLDDIFNLGLKNARQNAADQDKTPFKSYDKLLLSPTLFESSPSLNDLEVIYEKNLEQRTIMSEKSYEKTFRELQALVKEFNRISEFTIEIPDDFDLKDPKKLLESVKILGVHVANWLENNGLVDENRQDTPLTPIQKRLVGGWVGVREKFHNIENLYQTLNEAVLSFPVYQPASLLSERMGLDKSLDWTFAITSKTDENFLSLLSEVSNNPVSPEVLDEMDQLLNAHRTFKIDAEEIEIKEIKSEFDTLIEKLGEKKLENTFAQNFSKLGIPSLSTDYKLFKELQQKLKTKLIVSETIQVLEQFKELIQRGLTQMSVPTDSDNYKLFNNILKNIEIFKGHYEGNLKTEIQGFQIYNEALEKGKELASGYVKELFNDILKTVGKSNLINKISDDKIFVGFGATEPTDREQFETLLLEDFSSFSEADIQNMEELEKLLNKALSSVDIKSDKQKEVDDLQKRLSRAIQSYKDLAAVKPIDLSQEVGKKDNLYLLNSSLKKFVIQLGTEPNVLQALDKKSDYHLDQDPFYGKFLKDSFKEISYKNALDLRKFLDEVDELLVKAKIATHDDTTGELVIKNDESGLDESGLADLYESVQLAYESSFADFLKPSVKPKATEETATSQQTAATSQKEATDILEEPHIGLEESTEVEKANYEDLIEVEEVKVPQEKIDPALSELREAFKNLLVKLVKFPKFERSLGKYISRFSSENQFLENFLKNNLKSLSKEEHVQAEQFLTTVKKGLLDSGLAKYKTWDSEKIVFDESGKELEVLFNAAQEAVNSSFNSEKDSE